MMEEKLRQAARQLSAPQTTFDQIAAAAEEKRTGRLRSWRTAAVVACAVMLAVISVAATTEVHYSGWVNPLITLGGVERRLDIELPRQIGESPCYEVRQVNVVPKGVSWLEALLSARYRWYGLDYGLREQVIVYTSDEYGYGSTGHTEVREPWDLTVGTTDQELWRHCFSIGEDGLLEDGDTLNGVHREEYGEITLQYATDVHRFGDGTTGYSHKVLWVDEENHTVFCLRRTGDGEVPAEFSWGLLEVAKGIIDANRE